MAQASAKSTATPSMEELLAQSDYNLVVPKKGETVKGNITTKGKKHLLVDIGAKTEGVVTDREYSIAADFITDLKEGDQIEAVVVSAETDRGQIMLSLKQAAMDSKWEYFEEVLDQSRVLKAKGIDVNKGGLVVIVEGMRGFVPSSQFGKKYMGKLRTLKGETIDVKAIEVDREKNRLIFSERHVSEAGAIAQREQALDSVEVGGVYSGVVSGVMPFGLFVTVEIPVKEDSAQDQQGDRQEDQQQQEDQQDGAEQQQTDQRPARQPTKVSYGNVEGLIHISEISWEKVNDPKDYHTVGDRIKVKVLGIDDNTGKLNLSLKQLSDDPWKGIDKTYPVGTTFTGKVTRVENFGVFVNVEPGVDGLVHSSKLTDNDRFQRGDDITVTVESVDPDQRRMGLSPVTTEVPVGYK